MPGASRDAPETIEAEAPLAVDASHGADGASEPAMECA